MKMHSQQQRREGKDGVWTPSWLPAGICGAAIVGAFVLFDRRRGQSRWDLEEFTYMYLSFLVVIGAVLAVASVAIWPRPQLERERYVFAVLALGPLLLNLAGFLGFLGWAWCDLSLLGFFGLALGVPAWAIWMLRIGVASQRTLCDLSSAVLASGLLYLAGLGAMPLS